jgi:hypothetical protein
MERPSTRDQQAPHLAQAAFVRGRSDTGNCQRRGQHQRHQRRGLLVYEYAPAEVRRALCRRERATKRETARRVAERCPELARYLKQPTKWGEMYWAHMLDAVAVGLRCWDEIYGGEDDVFACKL